MQPLILIIDVDWDQKSFEGKRRHKLKIGTRSVHVGSREKIGELRNKNRADAFLMPVFHLATLFAEFIVGISERNLEEILTIILLKSPFILTS